MRNKNDFRGIFCFTYAFVTVLICYGIRTLITAIMW